MNLRTIPHTEAELYQRAKELHNVTLASLAHAYNFPVPLTLQQQKGWIGQLLEHHLGATANNLPVPDFQHLNIELKTIPVNAQGKAQESTYICTAPYKGTNTWENSVVKSKLSRVLWIPINEHPIIGERSIGRPILWSPDEETMQILQQDFETLSEVLCLGNFAKISAHLGEFLQLRPKAANSLTLINVIDDEGHLIQITPKGFYLRQKLTNKILKQY